ncbi:MAG: helix-turn-helix transcriptional regulator [bacterium]|nr:helix-turn-helix transcriptional regulator [bacterium]
MKTQQKHLSLGPEAIVELFNPARLEIFESLQVTGPASAAELARRLGRRVDTLYYHLKKLQRIGVVAVSREEGGQGPGRIGVLYRLVAMSVTMKLDLTSPTAREAWAKGSSAVLRLADRDVRAALESPDARPEGPRRNLIVRRYRARLTPAELKKANSHIQELQELFTSRSGSSKGKFHVITTVLTPVE